MSGAWRKAVLVDRDDTLCPDVPYCKDPSKVRVFPGVPEAVRRLNNAGYLVIMVTNQSGIGRGYLTVEDLKAVNDELFSQIARGGGRIDDVFFCPHRPDEGCGCRKPKTGLGEQAIAKYDLDPGLCWVVGDKDTDMQFGQALGMHVFQVSEEVSFADAVETILAMDRGYRDAPDEDKKYNRNVISGQGWYMLFKTESLKRMSREIGGFADDLTAALELSGGISKKYKHVMICGMGASAIGGALFVDSMYYSSKISVEVVKTMNLPAWVDKDTLFVACSYSGNTYETVEMYKEAIAAGIDVIAVTHGGELMELSKKNGNPAVVIGGELIQPRSAIGWFIGILGGIIEDAGGPNVREQLKSLLPKIREYLDEFQAEGNYAFVIALRMKGKVPVIYGAPNLAAMALRMKTQLNENSKVIAFSGVLPEFNHNEIVGWYDDDHKYLFHPVLIVDDDYEEIAKIIKATKGLLNSRDVGLDVFKVKGESVLEKNIYAVLFGDYVSLYLAALREVDPCNVDPIKDIKARINAALHRK